MNMTVVTTALDELLDRLRCGEKEAKDTDLLEQSTGAELIDRLRLSHPVVVQERTIGGKWEIALARKLRPRLISRLKSASFFVSLRVVPVYLDCFLLSVENDRVSGIAHYPRLALQPAAGSTSDPEILVSVAAGWKLALFPDGWELNPLRRKTTRLPREFMVKRGWRFPTAGQYLPTI